MCGDVSAVTALVAVRKQPQRAHSRGSIAETKALSPRRPTRHHNLVARIWALRMIPKGCESVTAPILVAQRLSNPQEWLRRGYERTPWMTLGMSSPKIILSDVRAS